MLGRIEAFLLAQRAAGHEINGPEIERRLAICRSCPRGNLCESCPLLDFHTWINALVDPDPAATDCWHAPGDSTEKP